MKSFKGVWIPYEILTDEKLNDKEKIVYSMILSLSRQNECTMSNTYIGKLLNISNIQVSRIVNSLKKKRYIQTEMIYKENSKEIAMRKAIPINTNENTYQQRSSLPINNNDKEIINKKNIIKISKDLQIKEIIVILTGQAYMQINFRKDLNFISNRVIITHQVGGE